MNLEIVTPDGVRFAGEATAVLVNTAMGQIQVLPEHEPLISALEVGMAKVDTPSGSHIFALNRGYIEVLENTVEVVTFTAESPDAIDTERAQHGIDEATTDLESIDPGTQAEAYVQARLRILRNETRLEVAKHKS